ncbi:HigA family addiction module antidote protein [Adhaeribacter sp. BT258]|uniref:HigA family addiction module antidote protein n=1 Tax=Adhaeribacter terrigena TaxID=2793070 RepID=A0ABS1BZF9_9BACT|nr:HigA family addiction module antitoxin [Adhaeribacter terrigena]MBK0402550.1 HigA family addiction module antidote protein [Adhaeribacter terrigena]
MEKLPNIHPGEILAEEFLLPLNITAYRLAKETGIPQTRISEILKKNRRITADTALRLAAYFGNSPKFWLGLQDDFDLEEELNSKQQIFEKIKPFQANAA